MTTIPRQEARAKANLRGLEHLDATDAAVIGGQDRLRRAPGDEVAGLHAGNVDLLLSSADLGHTATEHAGDLVGAATEG